MTDNLYVPSTQRGVFLNAAGWVFAILGLFALVAVVFGVVQWVSAPTRGKLSAREQIQSGPSRIVAYNHFFDLCASVQTLEGQLVAQLGQLPSASGDDVGRIRANIAGIEGARAGAVAEYNADARKGYTIGQFRSSQLPYQLPSAYTKGVQTSCTA